MREFEAFIAVQECALSASREARVERLRIDLVPGPNVPFPPMEALLWINDWMPWHRADGLLQRALFLQAEPCNLMPA